ncbi:MAG TPA: 1,4-dihydroxy-2-naphthoate polyprenyltransferase [Candidatus Dormibacteraeota bacterium]|nr:1,4-dihydroxy-2-naphthoate polyprenyltransferase [Candidatus Dormibacteraeota bacterium]
MSSAATAGAQRTLTQRRMWFLAARPATLPASISPVLVGIAAAGHDQRIRVAAALLALVVAIALQVGVNYANDYSDFVHGADTPARIGPLRAAASGLVPARQVLLAALLAFAVAAAAGLALSLLTYPWLIAVGAACIAAAWLYTGGPRPYGYAGFGELSVFIFFGLVATCGTAYVNEGRVTLLALLGGIAMGCFACSILLLNNIRDVDTDSAAGKRTLAVRIGRTRARTLLFVLVLVAYAAPVAAVASGRATAWLLLTLVTAPLMLVPLRNSAKRTGPPLIRALVITARAMAAFAVVWAATLSIS